MERSPEEWKAIADSAADSKKNLMTDKKTALDNSAEQARSVPFQDFPGTAKDRAAAAQSLDQTLGRANMELASSPDPRADEEPFPGAFTPVGESALRGDFAIEQKVQELKVKEARERAMAAADTNPNIVAPDYDELTIEEAPDEENDSDLPRERTFIGRPPERPQPEARA
jgi:hypothetical protein